MNQDLRSLLVHAAAAVPLLVLAFLVLGGFFSAWEGRVVQQRPYTGVAEPEVSRVLLVDGDGGYREVEWPVALVDELNLPVGRDPWPPEELPDDAPKAIKKRFQLAFLVVGDDDVRSVPTTSPMTLLWTVLLGLILLLARNGWVSGNPFRIAPSDAVRVPVQARMGQPAAPPRPDRPRPKKGPPPKRRRKGR